MQLVKDKHLDNIKALDIANKNLFFTQYEIICNENITRLNKCLNNTKDKDIINNKIILIQEIQNIITADIDSEEKSKQLYLHIIKHVNALCTIHDVDNSIIENLTVGGTIGFFTIFGGGMALVPMILIIGSIGLGPTLGIGGLMLITFGISFVASTITTLSAYLIDKYQREHHKENDNLGFFRSTHNTTTGNQLVIPVIGHPSDNLKINDEEAAEIMQLI